MGKIWFIGLVIFVVLISGCYGPSANVNTTVVQSGETPAPGSASSVEITNFAFNPATITVPRGTTVVWTNSDNTAHTVTGSGFDSGTLDPGQTFSRTFNNAGTFEYGCSIHPTMRGEIVVT